MFSQNWKDKKKGKKQSIRVVSWMFGYKLVVMHEQVDNLHVYVAFQ